jgi:hypothetical protein
VEDIKSKIEQSIKKLELWVESHNYKAYEPFDALSSPFRFLTFGSIFLDRVLMQVVRRSAFNLRPILGIKPLESTKGRGYMASGYLTMYKITNKAEYKEKALACLDWLDKNKSPKFTNHSWANYFDFSSRGGKYTKHESIIVWTALIGFAYLDAYEMFHEKKHLDIIVSISKWILSLPREKTSAGTCISYMATHQSSIHNSNMLGAAFLARAAKHTKDAPMLEVAKEAMVYSCTRQLPDGSWNYGENPKYHWFDNFHTGYNLDSLKTFVEATGDTSYGKNLEKGFNFFKKNFFLENGCPKYYNNNTYPVDSQCASQAIETLANFSDNDSESMPLCTKVATWWIDNMQDKDGHFYFRLYKSGIKDKTPMLHWAQATTYKALSQALLKISYLSVSR